LLAAACSETRDRPSFTDCPTWVDEISPLLEQRCVGCHAQLSGYTGALARGDGMAGRIDPSTADDTHRPATDVATHTTIAAWTSDACDFSYFDSAVHSGGIHNPADDSFHGRLVEQEGWDLGVCADCHGDDFAGGGSGASCTTCHAGEGGPTACDTCHEASPTTGAHTAHLALGASCDTCHVVPDRWDAEGHVRRDGAGDPSPADVTLGGLASATPDPDLREGPPSFDHATQTCSNVYCHGDVLGDGGAALTRPRWHGGSSQAACGSCHATPPATPVHADPTCVTCHPAQAPHVDGAVTVGRVPGCTGCHGQDDDPAPPIDLAGNLFTTSIGVGAHQSHLRGTHRLRGPLPCNSCHVVPVEIDDEGHLGSAGPAEVTMTEGSWDRASETCSGTWCHGDATPVWTRVNLGEIACGTCHGIPPATSIHDASMTLSDCVTCHTRTVDPFGNILLDGPPGAESEHMDGDVDF
jgi:predicted CxxxxCH...CXXCH cytochrome family protein